MRRPLNSISLGPPSQPREAPAEVPSSRGYLDLYGLLKPPFGEGRDNGGYIHFKSQQKAFDLLTEHLAHGTGVMMLVGEEGIGKSETLRAAASISAGSGQKTILVSRTATGHLTLAQLVAALLNHPNAGEWVPERVIEKFLDTPCQSLIIDDVDLLSDDCLDLLLGLVQAIPADSSSPAIVLSCTAILASETVRPELTPLTTPARQTIRLPRLAPAESLQFIERFLWIAGGTARRLIAPDAMKLIVTRSGGVPGLIDRHMEAVFTTGFARSDAKITARTVTAAMGSIAPAKPKYRDDPGVTIVERVVQITAAGFLAVGASVFLYKATGERNQHSQPVTPVAPVIVAPLPQPPQTARPADTLSPAWMAALLKRGGQSLALGDVAVARLLFQRAAEAGSAEAAVSLGKTYDKNFIPPGSKPDPAMAIEWYKKAVVLGDTRAADLIQRLSIAH